jgi:hypothetical protein
LARRARQRPARRRHPRHITAELRAKLLEYRESWRLTSSGRRSKPPWRGLQAGSSATARLQSAMKVCIRAGRYGQMLREMWQRRDPSRRVALGALDVKSSATGACAGLPTWA